MSRRAFFKLAAVAAVAVAVAAAAVYLVRGDRFRLYSDADAGRCWDALEQLTPPSSTLEPRGVETARRQDGSTDIVITYRMDRVLAGLGREIRCVYPAGSDTAASIVLNGSPLEPARLDEVNRALR